MEKIKNIIFDFGGVLINLDYETPLKMLKSHAQTDVEVIWKLLEEKKVFELYEGGLISDNEFRASLNNFFVMDLPNESIDEIWNAILVDIPQHRIDLLEKVKTNYRIFLLSNSNQIHYVNYVQQLKDKYGYNNFDEIFEKAYFSHNLKMLKPNKEIFQYVLNAHNFQAEETLFIDDTLKHTQGANKLGIHTHWLRDDVGELFDDKGRLRYKY